MTDPIQTVYSRQYPNILNALSGVGGTYSSMVAVGSILSATFSYRLLTGSLIAKLFHFKPRFASEIVKKKRKNKKKIKKCEIPLKKVEKKE